MKYRLKKVAVLGSGVMGSGIACHLANVGLEVLMLDIIPRDLKGDKLKDPTRRNSIVNSALQNSIRSKPAPLYHKSFASRISTGNFEDDFEKISVLKYRIFAFFCHEYCDNIRTRSSPNFILCRK